MICAALLVLRGVQVAYGQIHKLVGGVNKLGDWQLDKAPAMTWGDGDVWSLEVRLPAGAEVEFKVIAYARCMYNFQHKCWRASIWLRDKVWAHKLQNGETVLDGGWPTASPWHAGEGQLGQPHYSHCQQDVLPSITSYTASM
jgi:hypothetical protein